MLWGGETTGSLGPLLLLGDCAASLLSLSAPDLSLVTGCVRLLIAGSAETCTLTTHHILLSCKY